MPYPKDLAMHSGKWDIAPQTKATREYFFRTEANRKFGSVSIFISREGAKGTRSAQS